MDEAAQNDMTVKFAFEAKEAVTMLDKVKNGFIKVRDSVEEVNSLFDKTVGFIWRTIMFAVKLYTLTKTLPGIYRKIKQVLFPAMTTGQLPAGYRAKAQGVANVLSGVFQDSMNRTTSAGMMNKVWKNLKGMANGATVAAKSTNDELRKTSGLLDRLKMGGLFKKAKWNTMHKGFKTMRTSGLGFTKRFGGALKGVSGFASGLMKSIGKGPVIFMAVAAGVYALAKAFGTLMTQGKKVESGFTKLKILLGEKKAIKEFAAARALSRKTAATPLEVLNAAAESRARGMDPLKKGAHGLKKGTSILQVTAGMAAFGGKGILHATRALLKGEVALLDEYAEARMAYNKLVGEGKHKVGTKEFSEEFVRRVALIPTYLKAAKMESESIVGLSSTIDGNTESMWESMSGVGREAEETFNFWNAMTRVMKDYAESGSKTAEGIAPLLREIGATLGFFIEVLYESFAAIIDFVKPALILIGIVLWAVLRVVNIILWVLVKIIKVIRWMISVTYGFLVKIAKVVDRILGITEGIKKLVVWVRNAFGKLKVFGFFLVKLWNEPTEAIKDLINWMGDAFSRLGGYLTKIANHPAFRVAMGVATLGTSEVVRAHVKGGIYVWDKLSDNEKEDIIKKQLERSDPKSSQEIQKAIKIINNNNKTSTSNKSKNVVIINPEKGADANSVDQSGNPGAIKGLQRLLWQTDTE